VIETISVQINSLNGCPATDHHFPSSRLPRLTEACVSCGATAAARSTRSVPPLGAPIRAASHSSQGRPLGSAPGHRVGAAALDRLQERGRQNFSPTTLKRLAEALDTQLVYTFLIFIAL
jgi:hypothetical protein